MVGAWRTLSRQAEEEAIENGAERKAQQVAEELPRGATAHGLVAAGVRGVGVRRRVITPMARRETPCTPIDAHRKLAAEAIPMVTRCPLCVRAYAVATSSSSRLKKAVPLSVALLLLLFAYWYSGYIHIPLKGAAAVAALAGIFACGYCVAQHPRRRIPRQT